MSIGGGFFNFMEITNQQKQVMLSGLLGDGSLLKSGGMSFNCQYKEYMQYKKDLLGNLVNNEVKEAINRGYKEAPIFSISSKANDPSIINCACSWYSFDCSLSCVCWANRN